MSDAALVVEMETGHVLLANPAWERLARRSIDDTVGQTLDAILTLPDRESANLRSVLMRARESADGVLKTWLQTAPDVALTVDVKPQVVSADGYEVVILVVKQRHSARVVDSASVLDDGSEVLATTSREQSALKLREVFNAIDAFAWEYDWRRDLFTYVSPSVEALMGYPREQWLTQVGFFRQVLHPEDRDEIVAYCRNATESGHDHTMEYRMIDARGEVRHVRDQVYLKRDRSGAVTHLHGLILDVTEKLQVAEQLRFSQARYRTLFDNVPNSLWVLDCSRVRQRLDELKARGIELIDKPGGITDWLRA